MLWLPITNVEVVNVAWLPLMVAVPSVVGPSLNVTVPVAPAGTVAFITTGCPYTDVIGEIDRPVVGVVPAVTVWVITGDVLPLKFALSLTYTA